ERRREEDVRRGRFPAQREPSCRRLEGVPGRAAWPGRGRGGADGTARQGVRHHGPSDEGLGAGRPGRRRGRRTVEWLDSASVEVRGETAGEVESQRRFFEREGHGESSSTDSRTSHAAKGRTSE